MLFNTEQARTNMLKQQLRTGAVLDETVLAVMDAVPREAFVSKENEKLAYAEMRLPLEHDQCMMTPFEEGRLLQALDIQPGESVLEVGTGSGYLTALLARLCAPGNVSTVDCHQAFTASAEAKLKALSITNVTYHTGNAAEGFSEDGPYDVIVLTGSVPLLSRNFINSLRVGGRLFAVLGESPSMQAVKLTRDSKQSYEQEALFETELPALLDAPAPESCQF